MSKSLYILDLINNMYPQPESVANKLIALYLIINQ